MGCRADKLYSSRWRASGLASAVRELAQWIEDEQIEVEGAVSVCAETIEEEARKYLEKFA